MLILHLYSAMFLHLHHHFSCFFDITVHIIGKSGFTKSVTLSLLFRILFMVEQFIRMSDIYHLFALFHSLNCFYFGFHCYCLALSSTSHTTAVFMLVSGHPRLEINKL